MTMTPEQVGKPVDNSVGMKASDYDPSSPMVMLQFYRRFFPYRLFFLWLNQDHVPTKLFTCREFAFTLRGPANEEIYLRYNSFNNIDEFKRDILKYNPSRFEIGPQYSARPRDRKTLAAGALQPQRRELVFDIDMTDYDEVRTCCTDKKICRRCWGYIAAAVKVLDHTLRETFGYKHLLWVYSGRRGIHCWISDPVALDLNDDQRKALVNYLEVIKGSKEQAKKVNVRGGRDDGAVHPHIQKSADDLGKKFMRLCVGDQDCFGTVRGYENLLALLPSDSKTIGNLRRKWQADENRSSKGKWSDMMTEINQIADTRLQNKFLKAVEDVILQYTYPRIDAEVSKHRNHLLKSPFCVHPSTGRVCVPVDPTLVDQFEPEDVPTVGDLLSQLQGQSADTEGGIKDEDWSGTSLAPYIKMFKEHVDSILRDVKGSSKAVKNEDSMEF